MINLFIALLSLANAANFIVESNHALNNRNKIAEYSNKFVYLINQHDNILQQFNQSTEDSNDFKVDEIKYLNSSYLWNLDIIDGNKDTMYEFYFTGKNIPIYVVDSGIMQLPNFENRIGKGISMITDQTTVDCMGHGTSVSSIIASKEYGVSNGVVIIPVRIFGCSGSATTSTVIRALEWIKQQRRGIVNMSISGSFNYFIDQMIKELHKNGFTIVVSAGNDGDDACFYSPASTKEAITVGSYNNDLTISDFSNKGSCVNVFAPGDLIISDYLNGKTIVSRGTSYSAPHVSAICAQILEKYPYYNSLQILDYLIMNAKQDSPNKMVTVPGLLKCIELKNAGCILRKDCSWFIQHGCRPINFCGFRLRKTCINYKRCKWIKNKCTQK